MGRALLLLFAFTSPAVAHVLPKAEFARRVAVTLDPAGVSVEYHVVLSEDTLLFDLATFFTPADAPALGDNPTRDALLHWYLKAKGERMAKSFVGLLDGRDVKFRLVKADAAPDDHNKKLKYIFRGEWPAGTAGRFEFSDFTEYVGSDGKSTSDDAAGTVELTLSADGLDAFAAAAPPPALYKPRAELKPDEEPKRRTAAATFRRESAPAAPPPAPAPPQIDVTPDDRPALDQLHDRGLKAMLDLPLGLPLLLLLAAGFGAAHAFTPGHGKTMVAAYLVGERGTAWHAVALGVTATAAHTGSVILVAVGLYFWFGNVAPQSAQGWLMLVGGLFIFGVGVWLLMQRLRGKADHVHLPGASDHTHAADGTTTYHPKPTPKGNLGWVRVVLLGLGGGIIPCWDAVLMLLVAMAQGQIGLAIPLLLAFSVGLAAVLVLLGLAVLAAHRLGGRKFGESRWFKLLPVLSAAVLVGVGLWFLRDGLEALK